MEIYQNSKKIGTLHIEEEGLYVKITCKTEPSDKIRRIYLAYPYFSFYLGIPDRRGELTTHLPRKHLPETVCPVASERTKDGWLPWRGEIDGVTVDDALVCKTKLVMLPQEALKFPAWQLATELIDDTEMAVLPLSADGLPRPTEREVLKDEENPFDPVSFDVPADEPAADGLGLDRRKADRPDL